MACLLFIISRVFIKIKMLYYYVWSFSTYIYKLFHISATMTFSVKTVINKFYTWRNINNYYLQFIRVTDCFPAVTSRKWNCCLIVTSRKWTAVRMLQAEALYTSLYSLREKLFSIQKKRKISRSLIRRDSTSQFSLPRLRRKTLVFFNPRRTPQGLL